MRKDVTSKERRRARKIDEWMGQETREGDRKGNKREE